MHTIFSNIKKHFFITTAFSLIAFLFLIFIGNMNIASATTSTAAKPIKNILLINSYEQTYAWTSSITKAVVDKLNASGLKYNIEIENMDTKRVNDPTSQQLIFNEYKYKFTKFKYDIVMVSDDDAFNLALEHRNELFPGVPVVFCGTNFLQTRLDVLKGQKLISGVNEDSDIEASLDIGLKLQPNIKNIYFIHDNTTTGNIVGSYINKLIPKYKDKYNIKVYDGSMSDTEIINKLKQTPTNSLAYITIFTYDKNNKYFSYSDLLKEIHEANDIPIYGTWDFNLGDGIIGGKLTSGKSQGSAMADIAIRVLNGENINNIPILMKSPNIYAFDYNELVFHKSIMANIPAGSLIINQPQTFYSKYKEYVWVGVSAVILLMGVIAILSYITYIKQSKILQQEELQRKLKSNVADKDNNLQTQIRKTKKLESELNNKNKDLDDLKIIAVNNGAKIIELQEELQKIVKQESNTPDNV